MFNARQNSLNYRANFCLFVCPTVYPSACLYALLISTWNKGLEYFYYILPIIAHGIMVSLSLWQLGLTMVLRNSAKRCRFVLRLRILEGQSPIVQGTRCLDSFVLMSFYYLSIFIYFLFRSLLRNRKFDFFSERSNFISLMNTKTCIFTRRLLPLVKILHLVFIR